MSLSVLSPLLDFINQTVFYDVWAENEEKFYTVGTDILIRSNEIQQYAGVYLLQNCFTFYFCIIFYI